MTRTSPPLLAAAVLLAALAFAASPWFVDSFNGFNPTLYPIPQIEPPVQPAGYAFSIWGLIYAWLIVSAGYGLWRRADDPGWQAARPALLASLTGGVFWLWVAERTVPGATLLIWAMLATALVALVRTTPRDRWLLQAPVAIYAGWLTAASCVSVGLILAGWGWTGQTTAALLSLALALALGIAVQMRLPRSPEYGLTLVWALIAVMVSNVHPLNLLVAVLAGVGALMMTAISLRRLWRVGSLR